MRRFLPLILLCFGLFLGPTVASAATSSILVNNSSIVNATQYNNMKNIVRTSDGTLHAFVQVGTQTATCNSLSKSGLLWFYSTDSGVTWTCGSQLSSDTTNAMYASADIDSSDNIYVVYSMATTAAGAAKDVFYQKLTKGSGATWTVGSAQTVLDGTASISYTYATLMLQGTTRIWLAARYFDGTNYQVSVYYSDGLTDAPTWTVSQATLSSASTSSIFIPSIARFGSKIGIFYQNGTQDYAWRYRSDSDGLTSWAPKSIVYGSSGSSEATVVGDSNGNIYMIQDRGDSSTTYFLYYNGTTWSTGFNTSFNNFVTTAVNGRGQSISTDGHNVWLFYYDTSGFSSGLSGDRKLVYKKCVPPYTLADCDATATAVLDYQGVFDKVWTYISSTYADDTTDAGNTTTADVAMPSASADIIYYGKSQKYDGISWDVSTNSAGGAVTWEYYNGSTWTALTFTASSNTAFQGDGWGAFTDPSDWATTTVNGEGTSYYYIRARLTSSFTTAPVGVEFSDMTRLVYVNVTVAPGSGKIYGILSENNASAVRVKSFSTTVTASTPNTASTAEISSPILGYTRVTTATQPSTMRNTVRTSDGTLHVFAQSEYSQACGNSTGSNNLPGLNWIYSTDSGTTWTCGGQLSSDSTNLMYASAVADSSDNIYVVYSQITTGAGATKDVIYRKLTKGVGATWTLEAAQTVLDGTASVGYHYGTIILEGTTRIWLAARYYDGTNYQSTVYYSDGFGTAPTWTQSIAALETAGTNTASHIPILVRFASKIGAIYRADASTIRWRYRADADGLTSWNSEAVVNTNGVNPTVSAVGDTSGNIYVAINISTSVIFTYFNGSSWSSDATLSSATANAAFASVVTDGTNVWVFYGQTTGLSGSLSGSRKLVFKKGVSPFATANFDTSATEVVSYHGIFDKVWTYISSAYVDDTTDAGNTTSADVAMPTGVGDIIYFGKSVKFDTVSYDLSTSGTVGQLAWEYYNGSSWVSLMDIISTTKSVFDGDGYITFIPHSDWAATTVNGESTSYYYVRAKVITAYSVTPIGIQFADIPLISWTSCASTTVSGTTANCIWTESNVFPNQKIRYSGVSYNTTPTVPSSLGSSSLTDGGWITTNQPAPSFTLADSNSGDTVKFQIQIDDSSDFGSAVVDYTSALATPAATSFTVGQAAGTGTYTTGSSGQTLSDGTYYWRVRATDNLGAVSSWSTANSGSAAFKVDTTAPATPGTPSTTTPTSSSKPVWTWTASSDAGSGLATTAYTFQWSLSSSFASGVSSSTSTTASFTHSTALTDGTWYFRVLATDVAGNSSGYSSSGSVLVDLTAPSASSLSSPSDGTYVNTNTPDLVFSTSTDSGSGVASYGVVLAKSYCSSDCTIDLGSFSASNETSIRKVVLSDSTFTVTSKTVLTEGTWTWRVRVMDTVGNYTDATRIFHFDQTAPTISISIDNQGSHDSYTLINNQSPHLTGTLTDNLNLDKVEIKYTKQNFFLGIITSETVVDTETVSRPATGVTSWTLDYTTLAQLDLGKYKLDVRVYDKAGNTASISTQLIQLLPQDKINTIVEEDKEAAETDKKKEAGIGQISIPELEKKALLRREKEAIELHNSMTRLLEFVDEISTGAGNLLAYNLSLWVQMTQKIADFNLRARQTVASSFSGFKTPDLRDIPIPSFPASRELADMLINKPFFEAKTQVDNQIREIGGGVVALAQFARDQEQKILDLYQQERSRQIQNVRSIWQGQKVSDALNLALIEAKKPVVSAQNTFQKIKISYDTVVAIMFDKEPTRITDVTIEETGEDYAIVSFKTNHPAWGKVNYGSTLSYGNEVMLTEREYLHKARLVGLEKGQKYFFEVMAQNKNYAYDAYYVLEMPK